MPSISSLPQLFRSVGFLPYLKTDSLYLAKVPEAVTSDIPPESNPSYSKPDIQNVENSLTFQNLRILKIVTMC